MKKQVKILLFSIIVLVGILVGHSVTSKNDVHVSDKDKESMQVAESLGESGEGKTTAEPSESLTDDTTKDITEEPTEETTTEPEAKPVNVSLMMVGDMLLHDSVQNTGLMADGTYNYDHLFTHVLDDIAAADVAVVNQEVMIGGADYGIHGYPSFNCREEVGDALVKAGFDVVLHATNHTIDWGGRAVYSCLDYWDATHPETVYLGINRTKEDYDNIYIYEKDGFKIAMLNYTYGTNGISLPESNPYIVNLLNEEKIISDLQKAEEMADFTIVYPHWGTEYVYEPDSSQKYWAQLFADYGADLILGAHPHVIEPVEWLTGVNGNKTLVYYSLGNFVSAQSKAPRMLGAMAKVVLTKNPDGTVAITDYAVEPLVTQRSVLREEMTTYKLSEYTDALAAKNSILKDDATFSIPMMKDLCRQVFGDLYQED